MRIMYIPIISMFKLQVKCIKKKIVNYNFIDTFDLHQISILKINLQLNIGTFFLSVSLYKRQL